jgi:hypothetical protein
VQHHYALPARLKGVARLVRRRGAAARLVVVGPDGARVVAGRVLLDELRAMDEARALRGTREQEAH